jgi:hypothetical protein
MRSHGRAAARLAGPAALIGLLTFPAGASAAPAFRDRVFSGPVARTSELRGATPAKKFLTGDGIAVEARVSQSVSNPDAVAQEIVTFLGSRVHGLELGKLRVFIGVPSEIANACGGDSDVLACYSAAERRMYIPDRDPGAGSSAGFTRNYAITHEYGHHIANFRSNSPFPALNYGAKHWSSYKFVCVGADKGLYFPGNQSTHYLDDPGEAFADSYAHLPENGFSNAPWQYNERLRPDAGAFAALRRDVLDPWRGSKRKVVAGTLNSLHRSRATSFRTALDGSVDLRLRGPAGTNFDIGIYNGSRLISRTRTAGSRDRLRLTLCRDSSPTATARVRVIRRTGAGAYRLTMLYP